MTLLAVALLFIGEDAVMVGFLQIIVYAGAIMVLFLFVIWLLNLRAETGPTGHLVLKILRAIAGSRVAGRGAVFPSSRRLICR